MNWPRLPPNLSGNRLTRHRQGLEREGHAHLDLVVSNPARVGFPVPTDLAMAELASAATLRYDPNLIGSEALAPGDVRRES